LAQKQHGICFQVFNNEDFKRFAHSGISIGLRLFGALAEFGGTLRVIGSQPLPRRKGKRKLLASDQ
jgi:hypothetical protein